MSDVAKLYCASKENFEDEPVLVKYKNELSRFCRSVHGFSRSNVKMVAGISKMGMGDKS